MVDGVDKMPDNTPDAFKLQLACNMLIDELHQIKEFAAKLPVSGKDYNILQVLKDIQSHSEKLSSIRYKAIYDVSDIYVKATNLSLEDIQSQRRFRDLVDARKWISYTLNYELGWTKMNIGKLLKRDHSTVVFHIQSHKNLMDIDKDYREKYHQYRMNVQTLYKEQLMTD